MMIISPVIVKHAIGGDISNIVSMDIKAAMEITDLDTLNDLELNHAGRLVPPRVS